MRRVTDWEPSWVLLLPVWPGIRSRFDCPQLTFILSAASHRDQIRVPLNPAGCARGPSDPLPGYSLARPLRAAPRPKALLLQNLQTEAWGPSIPRGTEGTEASCHSPVSHPTPHAEQLGPGPFPPLPTFPWRPHYLGLRLAKPGKDQGQKSRETVGRLFHSPRAPLLISAFAEI